MRLKFLSHLVSSNTPSYGSLANKLSVDCIKSITRGDSSNVFTFTMENHLGTHVDCPAHFFMEGTSVAKYPANAWFFQQPFVVHIHVAENQLVSKNDLGTIPDNCDLLLIKTGFQQYRGTEKYSCENPGLDSEIGEFLRNRYPSLRAVGLDLVSISSYGNRELGRKTHKAFLDPAAFGAPILIIEDIDLDHDLSNLRFVWILPWRIEEMDSAPCTVVGIFDD